jgi:pSer/pThr/pTyr-binding forkhead associated (FHA) protein
MQFYYLEIIRGNDAGQRYLVPDGAVSIGRSSRNTIALPPGEKCVSGHHAVIYKSPERLLLNDFQSTNGTFVNDERIEERILTIGDIIGFGQGGPRLKLIVSDIELDTSPLQAVTSPPNAHSALPEASAIIKTQEEHAPMILPGDITTGEDRFKIDDMNRDSFDYSNGSNGSENPSATAELEKKLIEKRFNSSDMGELMKDGDKLEKIIAHGNISATHANMLRSAYKANHSMRKQWYYIVAALVFVSFAVSSFFAIRAYQYKNIVSKARMIKRDLDKYEEKIAEAKNDPNKSKDDLKSLIAKMEEKEKSLSSLKTQMTQDDFGKFYTDPLEQRIDDVLMRFGETDYHIPAEMIDRVKYHLEYYSGRLNESVSRYLSRKEKYFPMIQRIFREKNLPLEFAYVSMLESGFNPMALSHAGARGLWQFMPKTGRQFGLVINDKIDERCDPEKATHAAAEYFKDLIGIFGGKSAVMLCMAAYNAGEGRVMGALRKIDDPIRNRDFWYIYRMGYLAEETNEYIPRVIAFIILSEHPEEYGFSGSRNVETIDSLESETDFEEFDYRIK